MVQHLRLRFSLAIKVLSIGKHQEKTSMRGQDQCFEIYYDAGGLIPTFPLRKDTSVTQLSRVYPVSWGVFFFGVKPLRNIVWPGLERYSESQRTALCLRLKDQ